MPLDRAGSQRTSRGEETPHPSQMRTVTGGVEGMMQGGKVIQVCISCMDGLKLRLGLGDNNEEMYQARRGRRPGTTRVAIVLMSRAS